MSAPPWRAMPLEGYAAHDGAAVESRPEALALTMRVGDLVNAVAKIENTSKVLGDRRDVCRAATREVWPATTRKFAILPVALTDTCQ